MVRSSEGMQQTSPHRPAGEAHAKDDEVRASLQGDIEEDGCSGTPLETP